MISHLKVVFFETILPAQDNGMNPFPYQRLFGTIQGWKISTAGMRRRMMATSNQFQQSINNGKGHVNTLPRDSMRLIMTTKLTVTVDVIFSGIFRLFGKPQPGVQEILTAWDPIADQWFVLILVVGGGGFRASLLQPFLGLLTQLLEQF